MKVLGVDTGGTFTDFIFFDGERLRTHKVLSTPDAPERAILDGIAELNIDGDTLRVVHGSTVATNALLEGKGARTVYVTNRGFADVLTIGRQARPELYNLQPAPMPPPVPPELCVETGGRITVGGKVLEPLTDADLDALRARIAALAPEAVAVNLLFSFLDDSFERRIAAVMPDGVFISLSSEVLPEYREYERGIATWLNASVGPRVQGYLARLAARLAPARLAVMRSSGDICAADQAGREAVHLLLSGPAAGLVGARSVAACAGIERLITFDMGGTSTDVALIDGAIAISGRGRIGQYPVGVPMVDMHSIGAGGGSVAWRDAGGVLQVGPESAGAQPGPVCYGRGGERPTVTDANVVLGRLPAGARLAGRMALDPDAARAALARLGADLGLDGPEQAALGIVRIADEQMVQALRVISVERGIDPREFVLTAFGGAGGLHLCALADALGIRRALAPARAGVLSALGMLAAVPGRQLSRTISRPVAELDDAWVNAAFRTLADQARNALAEQGVTGELLETPSLDLCYQGQSTPLNVPWRGLDAAAGAFAAEHEARYGHRLDAPVELLNLRLGVQGESAGLALPEAPCDPTVRPDAVSVFGCDGPVPVWPRSGFPDGPALPGPLIVCDAEATVFVAAGWRAQRDAWANLHLQKDSPDG